MSAFTRKAPLPVLSIRWSIVVYDSDDCSRPIPSFKLAPGGEERSTINLHFPGLFLFGMIPRGLMWTPAILGVGGAQVHPTKSYLPFQVGYNHLRVAIRQVGFSIMQRVRPVETNLESRFNPLQNIADERLVGMAG